MIIDKKQLQSYKISVVKSNACRHYAAELLQRYIFKCTGVFLEIIDDVTDGEEVFLVGGASPNTGALRDNGFHIFPQGKSIVFCAATDRGLLFSVCDFVERVFGVRFLTATAEHIPTVEKIDFKEEIFSLPSIPRRTYLVGSLFEGKTDMDFSVKCRDLGNYTEVDEKHGGKDKVYGRNTVHNMHCYVPFETYGNEHPEFYRCVYVNGEIVPTIDITNGIADDGTLDESMELSVAKIVVEEMKKDVDAHPDVEIFNITQEDGSYYFDDERNRALEKKYKRSGMLIRFCNVIVRALNDYVREKYPNRVVKIITFSYIYTREAPVRYEGGRVVPIDQTVVADENLIIQMAYCTNGYYNYFSGKDEELDTNIREWAAVGKQFWFWMYDVNFHRYLYFYDSFHNIEDNVRGFERLGVNYLMVNPAYECINNWQCNMRGYVYYKLMWDASKRADELLKEYADLFYGAGSSAVLKMIEHFHTHYKAIVDGGRELVFQTRGNHEETQYNSLTFLSQAIIIIENGEKAVRSTNLSEEEKEVYLKRLAQVKATPISMIFDRYEAYYPNNTEEERQKYGNMLRDLFFYGDMMDDCIGERWTMRQYFDEMKIPE